MREKNETLYIYTLYRSIGFTVTEQIFKVLNNILYCI
jgi:hypothetical protein